MATTSLYSVFSNALAESSYSYSHSDAEGEAQRQAPTTATMPLLHEAATSSSDKENMAAETDVRGETTNLACITNKTNNDGQKASAADGVVAGRRPAPAGVRKRDAVIPGVVATAAATAASTDKPMPNRDGPNPNPRENLRRSLLRRTHSLTAFEQHFLEDIVACGGDDDAAAASAVLQDDDLFFDVDGDADGPTMAAGAGGDLPLPVHPPHERAVRSASSQSAPDLLVRDAATKGITGGGGGGGGGVSRDNSLSSLDGCVGVGGGGGGAGGGSSRRESTLKSRREQQSRGVHGGMWKAHDRGISTNGTISKGFLRRNSSAGMLPPSASSSGMGMGMGMVAPSSPAAARAALQQQHRRDRFWGGRSRSISQSARDLTTLGNSAQAQDEGGIDAGAFAVMSVPMPPPKSRPFGGRGSLRSRENLIWGIPRPPSLRNLGRQSSTNSHLSTSASIGRAEAVRPEDAEAEAGLPIPPIRYAEGSTATAPPCVPPTPTPTPPPDMVVTDAATGEAEIILDEDAPPLLSRSHSSSSRSGPHPPIRRTLTPKISNVSDISSMSRKSQQGNANASGAGGGGRRPPLVGLLRRGDSESSLVCATGASTRSLANYSRGPRKSREQPEQGIPSNLACSTDVSQTTSGSLSTFNSGTTGTDSGVVRLVESIDAEELARLPSRGVFVPGVGSPADGGAGGGIRVLDDHHHHHEQRRRDEPPQAPAPPPQPRRVVSTAFRHVQRPIMTRLRSRGDGIEILNHRTDFLRSILPSIPPSPSHSPREDASPVADEGASGGPSVQVQKPPALKRKAHGHARRGSRSSFDLASGPIIFRSLSSGGLADMLRSDSSLNAAGGARSVSSDVEVCLGGADFDGASTDVSYYDDLDDDDDEWDIHTESVMDDDHENYDPWQVLRDEYAVGYYGEDALPFRILGTSADDVSSHPHVLSPPLMESLQSFLPPAVSEGNFWMKYSLVRDGASLLKLLQRVRGSTHTILALETVDGEVFGSFTSIPWRKHHGYFGTGECFLWRMREPRSTKCHSITDQAQLESEIDVFPWMGENECNQVCRSDQIGLGGGELTKDGNDGERLSRDIDIDEDGGFGLTIGPDLLYGSSSSCATFGNPCLSKVVKNGRPFEIVNLEVWALTPCVSEEEAEKLELMKLFLEDNGRD